MSRNKKHSRASPATNPFPDGIHSEKLRFVRRRDLSPYIPEMLGSESKVLMVECVELLVLRHGTVVFTRPIHVIIVDVELLFKSQKKRKVKNKNIQADNQIGK